MEVPRAAQGLRLLATRTGAAIDEVASAIRGAQTGISGEHFVLTDETVIAALREASERGAGGTLLADPLMVQNGMFRAPEGIGVIPHGGLDRKVHTKLTTIDGERSLFSTTGMSAELRADPRIDFLLESRDAAGALDELSRAAVSGDDARMTAAAQRVADVGFLVNDPAIGVFHLRQGLRALAANATGDAYLGTKLIDTPKMLRWLAQATDASGSKLRVETHGGTDGGKAGRRQATKAGRKAGVDVHRIRAGDEGVKLHANVAVVQTDDGPRLVVMTAPNTKRGLGNSAWPIKGREIGVVVDDPAIIRSVLDEIGTLDGSHASAFADRILR